MTFESVKETDEIRQPGAPMRPQAGRQTGRQTDRQAGRQAGRQADRQTDRQAGRQAGRQAQGTLRAAASSALSSAADFSWFTRGVFLIFFARAPNLRHRGRCDDI
jgi:hypothetical protein